MLQMEVACRPLEQIQEWIPEEEKTAVTAKSSGSTYRLLCDLAQLLSLCHAVARAQQIEPTPEALERLFWMRWPSQGSSIGSRASARCSMAVKKLHDRQGERQVSTSAAARPRRV
jgi:hypothetical protein